MNDFKNGDTVFLGNGAECELVEVVSVGFLVRQVFESEDGEPAYDDPRLVTKVYRTAPTERIDAAIEAKTNELRELDGKLREARAGKAANEKELAGLMSRLKRVPALENLEAFIDKRVTHYVVCEYWSVKIMTFAEAIDDDKELRLLSLFGRSGGDVAWRIGMYSDHSGSSKLVTPCLSYDAAKAEAIKNIERLCQEFRDIQSASKHLPTSLPQSAEELLYELPRDIREHIARTRVNAAIQARKKSEEAHQLAEAEYVEAMNAAMEFQAVPA